MKKLFALLILLTSTLCFSQLVKPTYEGIVMQSATSDKFVYNPAQVINGNWFVYYSSANGVELAYSRGGLNNFTTYSTNAPGGSIYYELDNGIPTMFATKHRWIPGQGICESIFYKSIDALNFNQIVTGSVDLSGEDRNLLYDNGIWKCYIRYQPSPRTIGFIESPDFVNWTHIREILKPDSLDGHLKQFYHMSVIKTDQGYFGLLNVYRIGNNGQDTWQFPPYTSNEHTVDVQLVWSSDGVTNWQRLNNRKSFIDRDPEIEQLFGWWTLVSNEVYIYTTESRRKHTDWENDNKAGRYYFSRRFVIFLHHLYEYKENYN